MDLDWGLNTYYVPIGEILEWSDWKKIVVITLLDIIFDFDERLSVQPQVTGTSFQFNHKLQVPVRVGME